MDEKDLQQRMDELADIEIQRDMIVAEKETLKQNRIPVNLQIELQEIEEEFAPRLESVELNIKSRKDQLQFMLKEYAKSVKSQYYTWSFEPVIEWDVKALDGYALNHPEILWMRKEGKPKTRLTPKKKI